MTVGSDLSEFVTIEEEEWINEQKELRRLLVISTDNRSLPTSDSFTIRSSFSSHHTLKPIVVDDTFWEYALSLPYNLTEIRSVRGKQARLTVWESLELFDICNDFVFLTKVALAVYYIKLHGSEADLHKLPFGYVALTWLICIYIVSIVAYSTRRWWLYHRIRDEDYQFFIPFLSLCKIREAGASQSTLTSLFMFERLVWTYNLAMRLLEDVPQVVVSTVYMAIFGKDPYIYFMIAYSLIMIVVTSYRMGSEFPLIRTLTLLFSRSPPVDSPILAEAAPLRRHFALIIAFNCFAWALTHFISGGILPHKIWRGLARISSTLFLAFGVLAVCQWTYLTLHAEADGAVCEESEPLESTIQMQLQSEEEAPGCCCSTK